MLRQKGLQYLSFYLPLQRRVGVCRGLVVYVHQHGGVFYMNGKIGPVAQVPPAAHHGQVDAGFAALHFHRQDVDIAVRHVVYRLLVQHIGERRHLVAQLCRLLKLQALGVRHHAALQRAHDLLGVAAQELLRVLHVLRVVGGADVAHTGARAALDLVEQTRARAVAEHRVFASAQAKHFLHQQNGFFDRPGAGIGAKVMVFFLHAAAVIGHARKLLGRGPGFGNATSSR